MTRYANRGKDLEDWLEWTNEVYDRKGLAIISKIPTAWKVIRSYSPVTKQYKISNAFPEKKSTVDFGGTASNCSIWFDAKATTNKTSFPLDNIHQHQIDFLEKVKKQGGKAFFLIHARQTKTTWLLWIDQLKKFLAENKRKSIPFDWFKANCEEIKQKDGIMLDYLPIVLRRNED